MLVESSLWGTSVLDGGLRVSPWVGIKVAGWSACDTNLIGRVMSSCIDLVERVRLNDCAAWHHRLLKHHRILLRIPMSLVVSTPLRVRYATFGNRNTLW